MIGSFKEMQWLYCCCILRKVTWDNLPEKNYPLSIDLWTLNIRCITNLQLQHTLHSYTLVYFLECNLYLWCILSRIQFILNGPVWRWPHCRVSGANGNNSAAQCFTVAYFTIQNTLRYGAALCVPTRKFYCVTLKFHFQWSTLFWLEESVSAVYSDWLRGKSEANSWSAAEVWWRH